MNLRSGKVMTKEAPVNQPVTSRQCVIAFCDNSEQLVNICCKNCEDKKFCQKHYMCMSCYVHLLRNSCENKRNPVCPLDRSELAIDPMLKRMIECDVLLDGFWSNMDRAAAEFAQIRAPYTTPQRIGQRRTVRRIRRQDAITYSPATTPPGVSNVREAMNAEEEAINRGVEDYPGGGPGGDRSAPTPSLVDGVGPVNVNPNDFNGEAQERAFIERQRNEIPVEPLRFPFWTDDEGNFYQTSWPNATTTHVAVQSVQNLIDNAEIMQSMIDNQENIPPFRDLDDEAANGFHDPNA
jgi:hypothetical protein